MEGGARLGGCRGCGHLRGATARVKRGFFPLTVAPVPREIRTSFVLPAGFSRPCLLASPVTRLGEKGGKAARGCDYVIIYYVICYVILHYIMLYIIPALSTKRRWHWWTSFSFHLTKSFHPLEGLWPPRCSGGSSARGHRGSIFPVFSGFFFNLADLNE